jgi:hypothetical protein
MTFASVRAMAEQTARQGRLTPHQLASLTRLDELIAERLTAGERQEVTDLWRAQGSPAAPSPAPADGRAGRAVPTTGGGWRLEGFPFFSQLDPSDGPEGWRQCQTSSIAMALRFMRVPGITDDTDYLKVVRQFGDTTVQESHRKALAKLGVRARFTKRCSVAQLQAEIKAGLPVVCGVLHHGPVSRPTGGGHYVTLHGFDGGPMPAWHVHDPYGELDLVNGGWTRQGGGAGRDQRYSFKNFNPRWDAGGEQWTWLFS